MPFSRGYVWQVVLALLAGQAAAGEPGWLAGSEITAALAGKTIEGRYVSGRGFSERYLTDGRVEYIERGLTMSGHWSVTAGTLCTIYDTGPAGGCFRVSKASENCFEFYFVTRTEEAAPGPENADPKWTARGAVSGQPSACRDGTSV